MIVKLLNNIFHVWITCEQEDELTRSLAGDLCNAVDEKKFSLLELTGREFFWGG